METQNMSSSNVPSLEGKRVYCRSVSLLLFGIVLELAGIAVIVDAVARLVTVVSCESSGISLCSQDVFDELSGGLLFGIALLGFALVCGGAYFVLQGRGPKNERGLTGHESDNQDQTFETAQL